MSDSWLVTAAEKLLPFAVLLSTVFTIIILTLPSAYSHFNGDDEITERSFSEADREHAQRSGYNYFQKHKDDDGKLRPKTTVQVVVLGDIGRSPRMQYHALSIASHGGKVHLVGYVESDVHPDIQASRLINIVPLTAFPKRFQSQNRLLFLLVAPLKIMWQVWSLYYALGYRTRACKWLLVQNPPSIPTLFIAQWICYFRKTKLVIDWHNFGYSILALRLGKDDPAVRMARRYEGHFSRTATAHFAVTNAMTRVLKSQFNINALALHDRPPTHFQPLTSQQRQDFRSKIPTLIHLDKDIDISKHRIVVSATSWTPDEDFSLLLAALLKYSTVSTVDALLPPLLVIITGKGPLKAGYEAEIRALTAAGKLPNVLVRTAWLNFADYALLLGSADLGVSLHVSTSGVDLPMKVVDMLGTGLPVAGWDAFEAWPELVQEGVNGRGFRSVDGLVGVLVEVFGDGGAELVGLRQGAAKECERRWDEEWMSVAAKIFGLE
jgi:beta-1,4-mannosyltransferase